MKADVMIAGMYIVLGIYAWGLTYFRPERFSPWLTPRRRWLLISTMIGSGLLILSADKISRLIHSI